MSPDHLPLPTVNWRTFLIVLDETKDNSNKKSAIGNDLCLYWYLSPTNTDHVYLAPITANVGEVFSWGFE